MDCSLPGSSVRGIFQARVLEWVAITLGKLLIYSVRQFFPWENRSNNDTNFTEFAVRNKWNNPCEELSMAPIREQGTGPVGCHTACPMGQFCFPLWETRPDFHRRHSHVSRTQPIHNLGMSNLNGFGFVTVWRS